MAPGSRNVYTLRYNGPVAGGVEFDWDRENRKHLALHNVKPTEFEQLITNEPLDVSFHLIEGEKRYRSVGLTAKGRLLSTVWTIRNGRVRAITAFPASVSDKKAFLERFK